MAFFTGQSFFRERSPYNQNRDIRGRLIIYDANGNRILHRPKKKPEDCFDVQTIQWTVEAIVEKTGKKLRLIFVSGLRERQLRIDKHFDGDLISFE